MSESLAVAEHTTWLCGVYMSHSLNSLKGVIRYYIGDYYGVS